MARRKSQKIRSQAIQVLQNQGGVMRTRELVAAGIHPRILYELRDAGKIVQLDRGVYGLPGYSCSQEPDLLAVAQRVPDGVVCLISALYLHHLTVQIPRHIDLAVPRSAKPPKLETPPVRYYWFSDAGYHSGIETIQIDGGVIKVYSREKTIVDCFRYRRKIGIEIAIEALRNYWEEGDANLAQLRSLASHLRVLRVMEPYLESIVHDQS